jgi:hypothetical protein
MEVRLPEFSVAVDLEVLVRSIPKQEAPSQNLERGEKQMSHPDPFLNLLKSISFIPLRLPRADVQPLQLFGIDGKDLSMLGQLSDAMKAGSTSVMPPIQSDIQTANQIQGTRSATVKLSIGLNLLGGIIGALTGQNLDVSAAYQRASSLTFEFGDVTVSTVSIILLDKFLNLSDIDPSARQIQDLMIAGNAGVTTAVARAKKYIVTAQDDHGVDINVDVPVIQNVAGGKLGISTTGNNNTKVVYDGATPITFGVQALRLGFDESGKITGFTQVAPGSGAVRGLEPAATGAPNLLQLQTTFAEVSVVSAKAAAR